MPLIIRIGFKYQSPEMKETGLRRGFPPLEYSHTLTRKLKKMKERNLIKLLSLFNK